MALEKRKRKANLHTPQIEDSEAPTSTSFYKGIQIVVKTPKDGRHLRTGHTTLSFHQTHHPPMN